MVFNATFNNISAISCRSVLLAEETGVHVENHRPVESHLQAISLNVVSSTHHHERGSNSQLSNCCFSKGHHPSIHNTLLLTNNC